MSEICFSSESVKAAFYSLSLIENFDQWENCLKSFRACDIAEASKLMTPLQKAFLDYVILRIK